jgi:hypothetical protein
MTLHNDFDDAFAPGPCANNCGNQHTGIAVRMCVQDMAGEPEHYESVLICDACWNMVHPDRVPVRVRL